MKNFIELNGTRIELSDETAENIMHSFCNPKDKWDVIHKGDEFYWVGLNGDICHMCATKEQAHLKGGESKHRHIIEHAIKDIAIRNWAETHNDKCDDKGLVNYLRYDANEGVMVMTGIGSHRIDAQIKFFSLMVAKQCIDHFGEEYIKEYLMGR